MLLSPPLSAPAPPAGRGRCAAYSPPPSACPLTEPAATSASPPPSQRNRRSHSTLPPCPPASPLPRPPARPYAPTSLPPSPSSAAASAPPPHPASLCRRLSFRFPAPVLSRILFHSLPLLCLWSSTTIGGRLTGPCCAPYLRNSITYSSLYATACARRPPAGGLQLVPPCLAHRPPAVSTLSAARHHLRGSPLGKWVTWMRSLLFKVPIFWGARWKFDVQGH